jgi:hypothetical protein
MEERIERETANMESDVKLNVHSRFDSRVKLSLPMLRTDDSQ